MIQISSTDSSMLVKATEGEYIYPSAKTELELPLNSVILTLDDSEMAVFRSASNFDVLFTAVIDNLTIDGASVTKDNIADKFADAATSEQGGSSFKYEVVDELPSEGEKGTIYLVPNDEGTHTEYLYVENVGWEQIGSAEVDLTNYYTKDEVDEGNKVNAAAFNTLQKSIGLNENLETLSGKSIQAQIDELKEGGSSNAYEKVEGIDITEYTDDYEYKQAGILAQTLEDGKWSPEFYLTSDTDWSSYIDMYGIEYNPTIVIRSADNNGVEIHSNRLFVYPSEGESYDIMYSDILTKDDFIKTPNLNLFGAVNVNEGQISGFHFGNYAQFPFLVNLNIPFEINITVTLGDDIGGNQHNIIDSDKGLAIAVRNRHFVVAMSSDGQTWDMGEHIGNLVLNANQTYRLRLSWSGSSYKLAVNQYDTNEWNYVTDFEFNSSARLFPTQIIVGKAINNSNYFNGSINLNECSLSINGNKVWEGMDDLGLSTRLATDLSNIDAKGESVINDMIDEKTKKFADQNYQIVDSLDEIAEPKEGMMAYVGKGDEIIETIGAPKQFELQNQLDTYLIFDFSRYVYTNDDSIFEIITSNYGEENIFTDFRIIADVDISIMTDTDLITIAHQNSLHNEWIFDFDEYVLPKNFFIYTFKVVEFDNRKCLQISYEINPNPTFEQNVAKVRINRLYTNWYFYLYKKSEEEPKTYQYTSSEWKEFGGGSGYEKVEGIDIVEYTDDYDTESQITIASNTTEDGTWNPTVELRCDTDNYSYIGMYGGVGEPFFDVSKAEENGDFKETWFNYEQIGWNEMIDGEYKEGTIYFKDIKPIVTLTQSEYDALPIKDPNTVYLIKG